MSGNLSMRMSTLVMGSADHEGSRNRTLRDVEKALFGQ